MVPRLTYHICDTWTNVNCYYIVFGIARRCGLEQNHFQKNIYTFSFDDAHECSRHSATLWHMWLVTKMLHFAVQFASITSDIMDGHHVSQRRNGNIFLWRKINVRWKFMGLGVIGETEFFFFSSDTPNERHWEFDFLCVSYLRGNVYHIPTLTEGNL